MYCLDTTELIIALGLMLIGFVTVGVGAFAGALHVYDVVNGWYAAAKRERERAGQ